jgi:salicylate hydroxylase
MAIEDGMVLARCMSDYADIPEALRRYELARLERISRMTEASLDRLSHMHNPQLADPDQAQAFMDRLFAPGALQDRYDWIFEYNAVTQRI